MPPPKDPKKYAEWLRKNKESHLGKPSPFKGKKHTAEAIEKNKKSHTGKIHTEKTRKEMSESRKGRSPWNKGKTGVYTKEHLDFLRETSIGNQNAKGMKHTDEWKKQRSLESSGEKNPFYNKEHNDETKLAISKANTGKVPWIKDKHHSQETRERLKITRMSQVFPRVDSKPERIMQIALALRGIKFEKHKAIFGQPDIFIEPNVCIFVDGDYWHNRPEVKARDLQVNEILTKQDYKIIRISDKEIISNTDKTVDYIARLLELVH